MPIKVTKEDFRWTNGRGHDQKPILYSQKLNNFGIGKKQHSTDQWWEKAFDNQLKNLDVASAGGKITVTQTVRNATPAGLERIARFRIRFVSGGVLKGGEEVAKVEAETETGEVSAGSEAERKSERTAGKGGKMEKGKRRGNEVKEKRKERKLLRRMVRKEMAVLKGRRL